MRHGIWIEGVGASIGSLPISPATSGVLLFLTMHPLDLSNPAKTLLFQGGAMIRAVVKIRATTKEVIGTTGDRSDYGTGFGIYEWDISDRLLSDPQISQERPRYPGDEEFTTRATTCRLEFSNTDAIFATTQEGAILRLADIEQAQVWVYAEVSGQGGTALLDWFAGRVVGAPEERAGRTVLVVRSSLWEAVRRPVLYEHYGIVPQIIGGLPRNVEQSAAYANGFYVQPVRVEGFGVGFDLHHGIVSWDANGNHVPSVEQRGGTGIALVYLKLSNRLKTGKYNIKFTGAKTYALTYPDGQEFTSSIFATLYGAVQIDRESWVGTDGTSAEFSFTVNWAAEGNPVLMAYDLLEKGLLDNLATFPLLNPAVKIDRPAFEALARRFASYSVKVSATNENSAWENKSGKEPVSYASLAQGILGHIGAYITMLPDGSISVQSPYIDDSVVWPHRTYSSITGDGVTLAANDSRINFLVCQYGRDELTGNYGGRIEIDLRTADTTMKVEHVLSLPYYKIGEGTRFAEWAARTFARRYLSKQREVSYTLEPGHGLLVAPGDRITIESDILPVITSVIEVVSTDTVIGDEARITALLVQEPEGAKAEVCAAMVGDVNVY